MLGFGAHNLMAWTHETTSLNPTTPVGATYDTIETDVKELAMNSLEQFTQLRAEVLARPYKYTTQIHNLGDSGYQLVEPISIVVEEYPNEEIIIARYPEVEVFSEGATESEAINGLKDAILDLYDELTESAPEDLGSLPRSWLNILTQIIGKTK